MIALISQDLRHLPLLKRVFEELNGDWCYWADNAWTPRYHHDFKSSKSRTRSWLEKVLESDPDKIYSPCLETDLLIQNSGLESDKFNLFLPRFQETLEKNPEIKKVAFLTDTYSQVAEEMSRQMTSHNFISAEASILSQFVEQKWSKDPMINLIAFKHVGSLLSQGAELILPLFRHHSFLRESINKAIEGKAYFATFEDIMLQGFKRERSSSSDSKSMKVLLTEESNYWVDQIDLYGMAELERECISF